MAATVNARDVQLQATSPANRILAVTMASNIVVSQDNVSGLGLVVAGTKMVAFNATSQVFQIAKTGTVSPASTTLTASLRNLTNTPVVTVTAGTITSSLTLVGGQLTINNANMTTDSATLRLTVVQDGVTYTDDVTLVKVREGADAIVGFLTNESHTVPADYLGNVTSYTGAGGTFKVFSGTTDITTSSSFSIQAGGNPSALTVSLGATTGIFSVTGGMPVGTEVTTLTLRAIFGAATIVKTFTLSKTRLPALARFIDLQANSQVFQVLKGGSVNPASITLTSRNSGLAGTPVFTVSPATATITSTPGSSVCNITYAGMGANESVTVTVTHDGLSDVVTLVKVREGVDGASGTNGTNGTPGAAGTNGINGANGVDAIVGFLTNEATTIPTTSTGTGGDFSSAGGTFKLFQGIVDKTGNGVTYSVVSSTGVTISIAQTGVYTVTGMSANSGSALLRAVFGTVTVDKVYSIAKSLAGATGANGAAGTNGTNGTNGAPGANGTNGLRGSRTFYVPLAGGTNTYSDTLATTTATVEGGPVMNDLVIQYNSSVGFSQSKFYQIINSVGSWAIVNAVVDGNLLVSGSVAATHIQANTFTADNAVTRGLTVRDLSGNIILSSGQNLDYTKVGGTKPPANATAGADRTNLNIGVSANFISNSGPYPGTIQGFTRGYDDTGKTANALAPSYNPWRPTGQGGVFLTFDAAQSPATGKTSDINNGVVSGTMIKYPIRAGARYEASVYLSTHRCAAAVRISWFDAAGNPIADAAGNDVDNSLSEGILANWSRSILFATAPANAATAGIYLRSTYAGLSNPFTFASMWYFGSALPAQTVASDWVDGQGANWATNVVGATDVNGNITAAAAAAVAARVEADKANDALAKVSSDNVLSKGEKGAVILEYNTISAEYPGIQAQSSLLGIGASAERVNFDASVSSLQVYMDSLLPVYTDTTTDTNIVGSTFRQKFVEYYNRKQLLLNAIAAKAATTSTWAGVTGTGKPADNATVGATFGSNISGKITSGTASTFIDAAAINNAQIGALDATKINTGFLSADRIQAGTIAAEKLNIGVGANLLQNSTFAHGTDYWGREDSGATGAIFHLNLDGWCPRGGTSVNIQQPNNMFAGEPDGSYYQGVNSAEVPIIPGQRYEFSAYTGAHRCNVSVFMAFNDASGTPIAFSTYMYNNQELAGGTALSGFKRLGGFLTAPANAATARLYCRKSTTLPGQGDSWLMLTQTMIAPASPSQTLLSPWSLGGTGTKITGAGIATPNLSAISATIGTLRTASAGARMEISDNVLKVFDGNGVKRVQLGNLDL